MFGEFERRNVPQVVESHERYEPIIVVLRQEEEDGVLRIGAGDEARFEVSSGF